MSRLGVRAASCPRCRVMLEASAKARQRCPSCGYRFALTDRDVPAGFGEGQLQAAAYAISAGAPARARTGFGNGDRLAGALLVAGTGALLAWLGATWNVAELATAGVLTLTVVLLGAFMSSFWRRYEELPRGQQLIVDLPRAVVWSVARILWAILRILVELLPAFG